jgi:lipoprotein-releasing system permease protein
MNKGDGSIGRNAVAEWLATLPVAVQVSLGVFLGALLLGLLVVGWFRLPSGLRHRLHLWLVGLTFVLSVGLGIWALKLPEGRTVRFLVHHLLIRVGATLSATAFIVLALAALVPLGLRGLEKGRFRYFVAARHLLAKKSGFLTAISALSILGVGLSSFALCAVISVMGGFGADLKEKILNNDAHIRVEAEGEPGFDYYRELLDAFRVIPGVRGAMPVISGEVMASSSTNTAGMILRGVDTEAVRSVIDIPNKVEVGDFRFLDDPLALRTLPANTPIGIGKNGDVFYKGPSLDDSDDLEPTDETPDEIFPGIVLGSELADSLHALVGDVLTLVSPMGDLGPMGLLPKTRKFRVAGIFHSGMYEFDAAHAYVRLDQAAEVLDLGSKVSSIDLRVDDLGKVDSLTPVVKAEADKVLLGRQPLRVRNWKEMNRNLFTALELEKIASFVVLSIAILVASFCIICTLLLMVTEKSKEIAILKAMGASHSTVLQLFLTEGIVIGSVGTIIGVSAGFVAMTGLHVYGFRLDPEIYYVERLPVHVDGNDYLLIGLCAFAITTLATLYPAYAASRLRPVEGIRHE